MAKSTTTNSHDGFLFKPGTFLPGIHTAVDPRSLAVATDPNDPLFDKRAFEDPDQALVSNMEINGFTSTIEVIERPDFNDSTQVRYFVVAGRRRRTAAIEADVPVTIYVQEYDDANPELIGSKILENALRRDLPPTHLSDEIKNWIDSYASSTGEKISAVKKVIAVRLGRTLRNVNELLELQNLIPAVRKAIEEGKINMTDATSRGAGITMMIDPEGNPDADAQTKALEKLLASKEPKETSAKGNGRSDSAGITKGVLKKMAVSTAVPKNYRVFAMYAAGQINQATACENLPWLSRYFQSVEGPGWEPEGDVLSLDGDDDVE